MSRARPPAPLALAQASLGAGDARAADRACRGILRREPRNAGAWHLHALVALEQGDLPRARSRIERAISLRSDASVYHSNLGAVLERLGDLEGAHQAHARALSLDGEPADNWFNHGFILLRLGRAMEAAPSLRAARDRSGRDPEVRLNLGRALERSGEAKEALREYRAALELAAGPGERWRGEVRDALRRILALVHPVEADPAVRALIEQAGVPPELGAAAAAQLRAGISERPGSDEVAAFLERSAGDRLLLLYLERTINRDPRLERLLVPARARLLSARAAAEAPPPSPARDEAFVAALALQCFNNEYVWRAGEEEERLLGAVRGRLERALEDGEADPASDRPAADLLTVSLYLPAAALAGSERLAAVPLERWSPPVAELLRRTLHEPREERELARELGGLGAVRDATSRAVRDQYEANPYPRWVSLPEVPAAELGEALARRFPAPGRRIPLESILVAGGGTGFEPLLAARQSPRARVVSLDLSRASLAFGARMARRLGIGNVRFVQGDLLDVADLGERFDLVLASGVLHHMDDPVAGLRALAAVLAPHGLVKIGLYSEYARDLVAAARGRAEDAGFDGSAGAIRRFRGEILDGRWPELAGLLASADFYDVSGCRDLVFHVHERRYTIPEVAAALAACGLRFLGFDAGAEVRARYRERFPSDPGAGVLANWAAFEAEHRDAFAGMYLLWAEGEPVAEA